MVWPLENEPTTPVLFLGQKPTATDRRQSLFCCNWLTCAVVPDVANCVSPPLPNDT